MFDHPAAHYSSKFRHYKFVFFVIPFICKLVNLMYSVRLRKDSRKYDSTIFPQYCIFTPYMTFVQPWLFTIVWFVDDLCILLGGFDTNVRKYIRWNYGTCKFRSALECLFACLFVLPVVPCGDTLGSWWDQTWTKCSSQAIKAY